MTAITLICGACRSPIVGGTGALLVYLPDIIDRHSAMAEWRREHPEPVPAARTIHGFPDPIRWTPVHDRCLGPDPADRYDIDAIQLASAGGFAQWTQHLEGKNWIGFTDWEDVLREAAGEIPSDRMLLREHAV